MAPNHQKADGANAKVPDIHIQALSRTLKVAAFDAKPFERVGRRSAGASVGHAGSRGFRTHLGIGIVVSDKDTFKDRFTAKFAELQSNFKIDDRVPFCPSSRLLGHGLVTTLRFMLGIATNRSTFGRTRQN